MDYTAMKERLTGDYREVFSKAELYSMVKSIDSDVKDEMMMNLFDVLLSAQEDGKPAAKMIGTDIEKFCDDYFQEYTLKDRVKQFPKRLYHLAILAVVIEGLDILLGQENGVSFYLIQSNAALYILGFALGIVLTFCVDLIFSRLIFKVKKLPDIAYYAMILIFMVGGILTVMTWLEDISFQVKSCFVIAGALLYIVIYLLIRSIQRYRRYGTIRKVKNPENEYEHFSFSSSVERNLPGELLKRYENINKKRRKKKQKEMTSQEYMEMLQKETEKVSNSSKGMRILYIVLTAGCIMFTALTSDLIDTLVFAVIICVIEFSIFRTWNKSNKKIVQIRRRILDDCEERGITIAEYVRSKEESNKN